MKAKPDIWMPFYAGDYLRDTGHLSTEQHGAYLLMLLHYWCTGAPLPADDTQLACITRLGTEGWPKHRPMLTAFFEQRDGMLIHKRVEIELAKAKKNKDSLSKRGQDGARVRWGQDGPSNATANATANAQAMLGDAPSPSPSPSPSRSKKDRSLRSLLLNDIEREFNAFWEV